MINKNVRRATDANGVNIIYEYDKANRVTKRCYTKPNFQTSATGCSQISGNESTNTSAVEYFYDGIGFTSLPVPNTAKGKLTRVVNGVSETRYAMFDEFGRLTQSQQITDGQTYQSSYEYNFSGALVKQTYPNGRVVENAFESDGDLAKIYGKANANAIERTYANSFSYTPDGRIEKLRLGNHRWEWAKFNERLQVTELNLGSGVNDASLWKLKYDYGEIDANGNVDINKNTGNIARQTTNFNGLAHPFVQSFKYDSLYRLTEAKETSNSQQTWKQNFSYDRYGNRINYENFVGTNQQTLDNRTHPSIDPQTNRFDTNQGYQYDFNGNLISDAEGRSFTFNGDNKQTQIKVNNESIGRYFYDGEGKRVKKITNSETVIFVYDGLGKIVAEYTTKEPPTNPTTSFTATDMLGSPRVITDSNGNVTSRRDFQPFGEELSPNGVNRTSALKYGSADGIRQKFTTYQRDDETLLDFAEARMYENRHARFTAVDPLLASGKSANPQTFNRYIYVTNNPLAFTDPTGLQASTDPDVEPGEIWVYVNWFRDIFSGETDFHRSNSSASSVIREPRSPIAIFNNTESESFLDRKNGTGVFRAITTGAPATSNFRAYGSPEQIANVENAINTVEFTGTFNMMNNSYKYSTGQASGTELGASIAIWGTNFIPGGQGGKKVVKEGIEAGGREGFTTLFRAVGESELDDVMRFGDYGLSPSQAGKYFTFTEKDMIDFAAQPFNRGYRMTFTSVDVPTSFLENGYRFYDTGGAGNSIHFTDEALMEMYKFSKPRILDAPWVPKVPTQP